jgi:phospholipase C
MNTPSGATVQEAPPGYLRTTIFEILQQHDADWNIFFADLPVALLYKRLAQDATLNKHMRPLTEFLDRARTADLPPLSWIDPKFSDVEQALGERELASDDHPEGDISRGQHLAWQIYDALARSPAWPKTLFVIFYDEHGGFFDHVRPPGTPAPAADPNTPAPDGPQDDNDALKRYGVRVPALAVSAWISPATADHTVYDHTSMLATILQRFCPDARQAMGKRTEHAQDLGGLLAATAPRPAPTATEPALTPPMARLTPTNPNAFGTVLRKSLLGF